MHRPHRSLAVRLAAALALALALAPLATARQGGGSDADVAAELDRMLGAAFKPDRPGAAVIVVKDGKTIYRKGFGLANVELNVPMRPEMVFEIGSVTKQFTSTAILMLAEQGKLSLSDDMRKYLPDFPDKGETITIEHLLTHTSGIPSYTDDPTWMTMWRKDMTPAEIIALTKDKPLAFKPGTKFEYDNTGYIILGAIIEKVSGMSYADFVRKNIFEPLGMTHSYYGSASAVIPNRASGYSRRGDTYLNAEYLSMTQPYAAGSLMSTVDDLAVWSEAIAAGKLLSKASWDRAVTPYKLADGKSTGYGYGWAADSYEGSPVIRHNGGIFGYVSEVARLPKERVFVAMLTNSDSPAIDTGFLATKIAAVAIGKPYREPEVAALDPKAFDEYVGIYKIDETSERTVTREGDRYFVQRTGRPKLEIKPMSTSEFFVPDSFVRFRFVRDGSGKVTGMVVHQADGSEDSAARTDKPIPTAPVAIKVDPAVLKTYAGEYALAPNFTLTITADGDRLMAQATGQPQFELFARSETEFFLKVVDAQISFVRAADGSVESLVLHQGGRDVPAKKVK